MKSSEAHGRGTQSLGQDPHQLEPDASVVLEPSADMYIALSESGLLGREPTRYAGLVPDGEGKRPRPFRVGADRDTATEWSARVVVERETAACAQQVPKCACVYREARGRVTPKGNVDGQFASWFRGEQQ